MSPQVENVEPVEEDADADAHEARDEPDDYHHPVLGRGRNPRRTVSGHHGTELDTFINRLKVKPKVPMTSEEKTMLRSS